MKLFRRRAGDPALLPFHKACAHVAAAQRALLSAVPTSRHPGHPLAEALASFGAHIATARRALDPWQSSHRDLCLHALDAALGEAERLRLEPNPLAFEALNARIGDVLHPLEAFVDAEQEMRNR